MASDIFFFAAQKPNSGLGRLIVEASISHTITHTHTHTPGWIPLDKRSARRRGRYLNNQHKEKNVHAISGIRTSDPNNEALVDLRIRANGHRDRGLAAVRLLELRLRIPPKSKMTLVSVVCSTVEAVAFGWSLVQRSPTERSVSVYDRKASLMRRPWSTRGCWAMVKKIRSVITMDSLYQTYVLCWSLSDVFRVYGWPGLGCTVGSTWSMFCSFYYNVMAANGTIRMTI
jgi:hypothetical protein